MGHSVWLACDTQIQLTVSFKWGRKLFFFLPSTHFISSNKLPGGQSSASMAAASQDAFCTVSQSISFLHPWISLLRDTALTFFSCSQAIHTCPVRMSNLFNRLNTEKMCQVPWCLHIPYETTVPGSNWLFSSPSTLYLPRHSRSLRYTNRSFQCSQAC